MKQLKYKALLRLFTSLIAGMLFASFAIAADIKGAAPGFTLKANNGENIKLSEHKGEVVMINFWASWCGPCRQEMPLLDAMYKRYKPMGFTLLGINVEDDPQAANHLLKDIPVSFPILYDTESTVSKLYDVIAMPSTVLIDRDGNMRYLHHGYKPGYEQQYEQQLKILIRE